MRKYHVQDFKDVIKSLKAIGFLYFEQYKRAEILIGESKSIEFINMYFLDHARREEMNRLSGEIRNAFLDDIEAQVKEKSNLENAFDRALERVQKSKETQDGTTSI